MSAAVDGKLATVAKRVKAGERRQDELKSKVLEIEELAIQTYQDHEQAR